MCTLPRSRRPGSEQPAKIASNEQRPSAHCQHHSSSSSSSKIAGSSEVPASGVGEYMYCGIVYFPIACCSCIQSSGSSPVGGKSASRHRFAPVAWTWMALTSLAYFTIELVFHSPVKTNPGCVGATNTWVNAAAGAAGAAGAAAGAGLSA